VVPAAVPDAGRLPRYPNALATSAWVAPRADIRAASRRRCSRPAKSRRQVPVLIVVACWLVLAVAHMHPACQPNGVPSTY
jgi:predicted metal-binding membrane protein